MRIRDARACCPEIILRPSRHRLYVRYNQKIARVIDRHAELQRVRSVDEFQVQLGGKTSELNAAIALTKQIKKSVRQEVGENIRFSAGLGSNHLLAKIAGKLDKPNGLAWLSPANMPERIAHLKIDDLPGISKGTKRKLNYAGIWSIEELYGLDPRHARAIWRSVEGERFIRALQGMNVPLLKTQRNGYGNSKILAPEYRQPDQARLVGRWLLEKSCQRMRRDGYCARIISFSARFHPYGGWRDSIRLTASQDTIKFLRHYEHLWYRMMLQCRPQTLTSLSVHCSDVLPLSDRSAELFLPLDAGRRNDTEKLTSVIDNINKRYGAGAIKIGINQEHPGFFERG